MGVPKIVNVLLSIVVVVVVVVSSAKGEGESRFQHFFLISFSSDFSSTLFSTKQLLLGNRTLEKKQNATSYLFRFGDLSKSTSCR